uniref:Uncharacterized protein n=1 Tax=Arundo donax TaxID=35708 RepID=A0A0A9G975_ARUDO
MVLPVSVYSLGPPIADPRMDTGASLEWSSFINAAPNNASNVRFFPEVGAFSALLTGSLPDIPPLATKFASTPCGSSADPIWKPKGKEDDPLLSVPFCNNDRR